MTTGGDEGDRDTGDDKPCKVGNKHPPKEHRFKPGVSGNPSGRPKGREKFDDVVYKELKKTVTAKKDGELVKITNEKIFAAQLVKAAITKGPQHAGILLPTHREPAGPISRGPVQPGSPT